MSKRSRKFKFNPRVEPVERRTLLSGAAAIAHHVALNGQVGGRFALAPGGPNLGTSQTVEGSGTVRPLGSVKAVGTLHTPGLIVYGQATGTITFSNARGSVTIALTGPPEPSLAPLPHTFRFQIVSATGVDRGARDTGTATLTEVEAASSTSSTVGTPIVGPIFGLTLKSR